MEDNEIMREIVKASIRGMSLPLRQGELKTKIGELSQKTGVPVEDLSRVIVPIINELFNENIKELYNLE